MLWQRICLTLLLGWGLTYSGIALLALSSKDMVLQRANRQGLQFWLTKVEQFHQQGGSLTSDLSLELLLHSLKESGQTRLNASHLLDPYGKPYQLSQATDREFIIVSAGADGLIGTSDDVMLATGIIGR